jgi:UDP-N-acetylglucosamine acyltransferase
MSKIHPSSLVDPRAELEPSVEVGPFCTIGPKVRIGKNTKLISHVVIEGNTQIGADNVISPFVVLGAAPQDLKYKGEDTLLKIGDRNRLREAVTINLGTVQGGGITQVGDDCLLMAYTHLGHDCRLGNHVIVANAGALAGHVTIEDYAIIGGVTAISQFAKVGAHAYIGGQTGVEKDVPPFAIAFGMRPCQIRGANIVGLRRRGVPAETISKINEAIKLWTRADVPKEQCLLEIESQYSEVAEIQQFVKFIRESEIGVVR